MADWHPPHTAGLTSTQRSRVEYARQDLDRARAEDLARLDAAGLILLVERLRSRLGDVLDVIDEIERT
ncbi:hypothetical protein [Streptomyces werraensis]|uniref:hypothetical protein n=1 Tax=Streptomyces werraensis TaxID=68284 RepID=UPI0036A82A0D